ncbi:MAG TPA: alpha/beta family hydrolase [Actinomycetota bacterium]|nr:alpha/beta family hydrolase [Actinomycetota bacterium]
MKVETPAGTVSATRSGPESPVVVVAHGAGGSKDDPLLEGFAAALGERGVGCLRFNFPYREHGRKAPDPEPVLRDAWAAAFETAGGAEVWVGGKSLGGRIASMCVADGMPARGVVFVGYPLHPPGRPERIRDEHLYRVPVPMLFLQGTADPFARWDLLEGVLSRIGDRATLHAVEGGGHSFRVRGTRKDDRGTGRRLGEVAAEFVLARR